MKWAALFVLYVIAFPPLMLLFFKYLVWLGCAMDMGPCS